MSRRLVWVQYRKLLQTTLIGTIETVLAGIADTVLAGHLFGDDALAGVNLVAPAASLVLFLSTLITCGAMISRSIAVGKCDRKEMDLCCSTGLWASLGCCGDSPR